MQLDLIDASNATGGYDARLSQWMTPSYIAEAIVADVLQPDRHRVIVEPSCGIGRFLAALPTGITAIGVEIDPRLADRARAETAATIVTGDFLSVALPIERADLVIGNPPFAMSHLDGMLARCVDLLDEGGEVALILPAFAFQTSSRVERYNRTWTIEQRMMPRTMFPGIRLPLMLARFVKERKPRLVGFLLYHESREVEEMPGIYRKALEEGRPGWKAVVEAALRSLGGEASIAQVCAEIAPRRPTRTAHWRPKVRQQLRQHFTRTGPARYALTA